jgi:4-amino-4-deoxy-L-arabinose transferase-like glycosyltransferase
MYFGSNALLIIIILVIISYFVAVAYLSKSRRAYLGLVLPIIFAIISLYNYIKPILVYSPYPTMKEGIYMTFFGALSIIGFSIFLIVKYIHRRT